MIVNLSASSANLIMRFCKAGTAGLPTSIAKSPRATMMPSLSAMMLSKAPGMMASARSTFAMVFTLPTPCFVLAASANWRAYAISAPSFGKLIAKKSTPIAIAASKSAISFSVKAGAVKPPPARLIPLLLESGPPCSTRVKISPPFTFSTRNTTKPSLSKRRSPGLTSVGNSL